MGIEEKQSLNIHCTFMCDNGVALRGKIIKLSLGGFTAQITDQSPMPNVKTYGSAVLSTKINSTESMAVIYCYVTNVMDKLLEASFESMDGQSKKSFISIMHEWRKKSKPNITSANTI